MIFCGFQMARLGQGNNLSNLIVIAVLASSVPAAAIMHISPGLPGAVPLLPPPVINLLSPSHVMVSIPLGTLTVHGRNFSAQAKVLMDGKSLVGQVVDSRTIEAYLDTDLLYTPAIHQVSVSDLGVSSNTLPWTVYEPEQGPQVFSAIPAYFVGGTDPSVIVTADVNGDGFDDVIMPGTPGVTPRIAILQGKADGTLAQPRYVSGRAEFGLAAGDVNGDGSVDFVAFAYAYPSSSYSVFLNDGSGNFSIGSSGSVTGIYAGSVKLVDIDADNRVDLLAAVKDPTVIYLLKNLGGGTFGSPQTLTSISVDNRKFEVADLNGDPLPDIIYNSTNSVTGADEIHWLRNQGGGSFADTTPADLAGVSGQISSGDFNRDGLTDLAIQTVWLSRPVSLRVFLGMGGGAFRQVWDAAMTATAAVLYSLVPGDFDHDGFPDLAGVNGDAHILYLWGDGSGAFTPQQANGPAGFYSAGGDINGDRNPDIVVPDRFDEVSVALGRVDRNFPSATSLILNDSGPLSAADINGDGLPDLFSAKSTLYLSQPDVRFVFARGTPADALMIADVNGDRLADYIGCDRHNLLIWPGTGIPEAPGPIITVPMVSEIPLPFMEVLDMDRDGQLDLIASAGIYDFQSRSTILYGRGNFEFDVVEGEFRGQFVTGDFNNDGIIDITGYSGTFLGAGAREFRTIPGGLAVYSDSILTTGDFNGDNLTDVAQSVDQYVIVRYARGDGTFYTQSQLTGGERIGGMAVEDFNGDGRPDIVTGLQFANQLVLYTNDGQGRFQRSYFASGAHSLHLISADFNNDRKPDVAIRDFLYVYRPPRAFVIFAASVKLTAAPAIVSPGGTVTATWANIPGPTTNDWVGLYASSAAPNSPPVAWRYTTGLASGNVPLNIPQGAISANTYELRLWSNNGYTRLATSNTFTVQGGSAITLKDR